MIMDNFTLYINSCNIQWEVDIIHSIRI